MGRLNRICGFLLCGTRCSAAAADCTGGVKELGNAKKLKSRWGHLFLPWRTPFFQHFEHRYESGASSDANRTGRPWPLPAVRRFLVHPRPAVRQGRPDRNGETYDSYDSLGTQQNTQFLYTLNTLPETITEVEHVSGRPSSSARGFWSASMIVGWRVPSTYAKQPPRA